MKYLFTRVAVFIQSLQCGLTFYMLINKPTLMTKFKYYFKKLKFTKVQIFHRKTYFLPKSLNFEMFVQMYHFDIKSPISGFSPKLGYVQSEVPNSMNVVYPRRKTFWSEASFIPKKTRHCVPNTGALQYLDYNFEYQMYALSRAKITTISFP